MPGLSARYVALLAVCFAVSVAAGWTSLGEQFDNDIYDFLFRLNMPETPRTDSVILGIDEESFAELGGVGGIRRILADGLERIARAGPKTVVVDVILSDRGSIPEDNARLAAAFAATPNLILATDIAARGWETPLEEFRRAAVAVGHVHADPDPFDNVVRRIALEKVAGRGRHWALALEAFRAVNGGAAITEEPDAIEVAGRRIAGRREDSRPLWVSYLRESDIPQLTFTELRRNPSTAARVGGKAVFVGITAQTAARDRHMTPISAGIPMPGILVHANAYETLLRGRLLRPASLLAAVGFALLLCAGAGAAFWFLTGWQSYAAVAALLALAHLAPYQAFRAGIIFPYALPFSAAWLSSVAAASFQFFYVRRKLGRTEAEKERYQKAIHFVAHEMRTPLSTIQGQSELMGRYKLSEEKQNQMARTINSESKRLARMIQTFLDVERLSEGQMDLKREPFLLHDLLPPCLDRVQPLADRKRIQVECAALPAATLLGDRELMEYAVYNLLTNAIKYSPAETRVTVSGRLDGKTLRLAVQDQGMGMDEKELQSIFHKFYRTKKAETSGEAGTGIGLSIVEQIVTHHKGKIEVTSSPGAGSCFTMVLPASVPAGEEVRTVGS